jgi:hypothetical protein
VKDRDWGHHICHIQRNASVWDKALDLPGSSKGFEMAATMISFAWLFVGLCVGLQALPPLPATTKSSSSSTANGFDFAQAQPVVFITQNIARHRDQDGLTLIPPSGEDFATNFVQELSDATRQV